jgi:hypothetical protein
MAIVPDHPRHLRPHRGTGSEGYPVTIGLSLTLALLLIFVPVLRARGALRRWTTTHVPVMVKPKTAELPFEEWEVLFRKELLLERRLHGLDVGAVHELPFRH